VIFGAKSEFNMTLVTKKQNFTEQALPEKGAKLAKYLIEQFDDVDGPDLSSFSAWAMLALKVVLGFEVRMNALLSPLVFIIFLGLSNAHSNHVFTGIRLFGLQYAWPERPVVEDHQPGRRPCPASRRQSDVGQFGDQGGL